MLKKCISKLEDFLVVVCGDSVHVLPVSMGVSSEFSGFLPLSKNIPVGGSIKINCP